MFCEGSSAKWLITFAFFTDSDSEISHSEGKVKTMNKKLEPKYVISSFKTHYSC